MCKNIEITTSLQRGILFTGMKKKLNVVSILLFSLVIEKVQNIYKVAKPLVHDGLQNPRQEEKRTACDLRNNKMDVSVPLSLSPGVHS